MNRRGPRFAAGDVEQPGLERQAESRGVISSHVYRSPPSTAGVQLATLPRDSRSETRWSTPALCCPVPLLKFSKYVCEAHITFGKEDQKVVEQIT